MLHFIFVMFLSLISAQLFACSAVPPDSVEVSFNQSKAVYLAIAKSVQETTKHNVKFSWTEQEVVFEVLQVWKGNYKVGEKIRYNTVRSV